MNVPLVRLVVNVSLYAPYVRYLDSHQASSAVAQAYQTLIIALVGCRLSCADISHYIHLQNVQRLRKIEMDASKL